MFLIPASALTLWGLLILLTTLCAEMELATVHLDFNSGEDFSRGVATEALGVANISLPNEFFDTSSVQFEALFGDDATQDAVFAKMKSVRGTDGRVFWRGRTTTGSIGYATIVQDAGGEIGGYFSLDATSYELIQIHDGSIRCVAVHSADLPQAVEDYRSTGIFSFLEDDTSGGTGEVPLPFRTRLENSIVSIDAANQDITCEDTDDELIAVVDVLLVVTHDAICQRAFQESPCDLETHRGAIDRLLDWMNSIRMKRFKDTDIKERRELVGADLVAFIGSRDPLGQIGGIAQIGGAYSVTSVSAIAFQILTHELGHNFGCMHHPSDTFFDKLGVGYILYFNFYGYGFEDEDTFSTVMSYGCESSFCPDIPYFSNDNCRYQGNVMGSPKKNNARKIRKRSVKLSRWRERQSISQLPTEITLFDTPEDGLQCAPAEAGICEYGKSRLSYNIFYIVCFGRCVDDDDTYFDFSFGIPFLSIVGEALNFVQAFFFCGPCKALINF